MLSNQDLVLRDTGFLAYVHGDDWQGHIPLFTSCIALYAWLRQRNSFIRCFSKAFQSVDVQVRICFFIQWVFEKVYRLRRDGY
jgi:hypothetical protein